MLSLQLVSSSPGSVALMRSLVSPLKWTLAVNADWRTVRKSIATIPTDHAYALDLDALASARVMPKSAIALIRETHPNAKIALVAPRLKLIDKPTEQWATMMGADLITPALSSARWEKTGELVLRLLTDDDDEFAQATRRVLPHLLAAARLVPADSPTGLVAAAEAQGIDLAALAVRVGRSGGVPISDRSYHFKNYPECLVASEAVDWLANALRSSRAEAIAAGRALQAAELIYHVAREQNFADENYFFRVSRIPSAFVMSDCVQLATGRHGFAVEDRSYLGTTYERCFIGSEAVAWMQNIGYSLNEAMSVGQRMIGLSMLRHVTDEHQFKDAKLFYRLLATPL